MKRKLFLLLCALLTSVGMWAYQTPVADGIYYLYNTASNDGDPGFMSTGNGYGFQVVIDKFGFPVKLIDAGNGNFKFQFIHHNGYLSDDGWMYSDGDDSRARTITIQDQGSGNYRLYNTNNSRWIEDWYGNVVGDGTENRHNYIWQFLSKAERDAIVAGYTTSVKMAAATSMGMPASVDDDEKFDAYLAANYIGIDQSSKITNGTFTTAHVTTDWSTTANSNRTFNIGWGNQDPKDTPEVYEGAGYLTHTTISVDKAGLYKVSVNATYRCGNSANNNRIGDLGYDGSVAYLQANSNIAKLGDWYSGKINGNGPGSPSEANSVYFAAGKYLTEVYVYVGDAKTIDISLHSHAFTWGGWLMFNNFKLTYYSDEVSDEDANAILATANGLLAQEMDATIKTNLTNAKNTFDGARTIANYNALDALLPEAQASVDAYALFAPERTKALALGMSADAIAELAPNVQDLKVAEYNYVTTTYPYGVELGEWTSTGTNTSAATFNNEHWSGVTHDYKNQNDANGQGWNANSWSINFSQDVLLPSGTYVFKVAGRQASGDQVTTSLVVKKGEDVLGSVDDFPRSNNSRGINKSGATAFEGDANTFANNGNGFGWEWRYVKFTLAEESTVNIAVNAVATAIHQWVSFGDYTLQADNDDVVDILAYNVAKASAVTIRDDAQYANVIGSERTALLNAINADPSSDYPAATTALNEASAAVVAAKPSYDAYALAKSYADAIDASALPYAASAKILAVATAKGATVTTAAEAVTATGNINTANRAAYESNMNAEGVVGAKNRTAVMTNPEGSNTAGWSGEFWTASNEPYTDASGSASHTYFDKNNVTSFTSSQTVKLPAGNYIVSVTARAQAGITYTLQVTNNAAENEDLVLTAMGNANGVFNRGWNVFTLPFTQTAYGDATISISGDNGENNFWMSWGRFIIYNVGNEEAVPVNETVDFAATGQIEDVDVTLTRTIKEGVNTLVLPFDMTQDEVVDKFGIGSIVYKVGSYNSENDNISFTKRDGIAANEPCILKATVAGSSYEFEDRTIVAENNPVATGEGVSVVGSYNASTDITKDDNNYIISGGKIYLVNSDDVSMKGTRAYIKLSEPNPARELILNFDDVTAINAIEAANAKAEGLKDGKYLIENKIVLVKNGVKYSANGQILK